MKKEERQENLKELLVNVKYVPVKESESESREIEMYHTSYQHQLQLCQMVEDGDYDGYRNWIEKLKRGEIPFIIGKVSNSSLNQMKYLFVTFGSIVVHHAIAGGLLELDAFTLSDKFLRRIDRATSVDDCSDAFSYIDELVLAVQELKIKPTTNIKIIRCKNYIHDHLYATLDRETLAKKFELAPQYLSKLFKEQTGLTITDYIMERKIKESKRLIRNGDNSLGFVSCLLNFSSQRHFTSVFKKVT